MTIVDKIRKCFQQRNNIVGNGKHTLHEIQSQPDVWQHALKAFNQHQSDLDMLMASNTIDDVIVTGCGSTHYLSMIGARLIQKFSNEVARAHPASELLFYPDSIYSINMNHLLIAVSRSGTTTETVRAVEAFKKNSTGKVVVVTCDSTSPLASYADVVFSIDEAQEESVAQTRSFSSMNVVLQQIAGLLGKHDLSTGETLPSTCQDLLGTHADLAKSLGENEQIKKFFFLGSDTLYGVACEAMLKMKEMSLSYSEAYHMMEFRHGPMSMVSEDSLVVGLISPASAQHDINVLKDMQDMGATILAIGQDHTDFEHHIQLPTDLPIWNTPVLYLPILQLMGYHRSLFNGQNPDNPHNLTAVISLDDI
jgi:glutamine---fructose-6-phosphate transaminase (isomerizing)